MSGPPEPPAATTHDRHTDASVEAQVAEQYREWTYPAPIEDLDAAMAPGQAVADDPTAMQWAYWPRTGLPDDAEILVAGCGTMQAAAIARRNPGAHVVGIDLSETSLDATRALKRRHRLDNLDLHQLPLQEVASLGQRFHQVSSTGVLHHLPDPAAGLAALRGVLEREGVLALMLYGLYPRAGVYMMQSLFRLLGVRQDRAGVGLVKATLDVLADRHPASEYRRLADDLDADAGLVDTFLHPCDRAYTVTDIFALLRATAVTFQGWHEPYVYQPDGKVPTTHPLRPALDRLDDEALWTAMERLHGGISTHFFYACRDDRPASSYRIDLDSDELPEMIPVPRPATLRGAATGADPAAHLERPPYPPIPLGAAQLRLIRRFDGKRTLHEAFESSGIEGSEADKLGFGRNFLAGLLRLGFIHVRLPATGAP